MSTRGRIFRKRKCIGEMELHEFCEIRIFGIGRNVAVKPLERNRQIELADWRGGKLTLANWCSHNALRIVLLAGNQRRRSRP